MAERSTAAVGVAETSDKEEPLNARSGKADADSATDGNSGGSHSATADRDGSESADAPGGTGAQDAVRDGGPRDSGGNDGDNNDSDAAEEADEADEQPAAALPDAEQEERLRIAQVDTAPLDPVTGETALPASGADDDPPPSAPELHSGHKLARRYRLEECVTRLDGFSSWRAVDEKLRRAVGVHILPTGHPRARPVLSAARSTALLGDPRFVQVLDAVEDGDLVYVVHEWLPDAVPLNEVLAAGTLEPHEAYQLVNQLSQALAAAHREGLAHLRLTPGTVLRTGAGQYRVRGLAVNAALRGITSDTPQRDDTEAIGALLYACLTQRWPYEEGAYGLAGVGTLAKGTLVAPDQVRAGVHRGLSQLAMRALVNDGATASSEEQPCATPEELRKAVSALPRIRPPEPTFHTPPPYQRTTYQQGAYGTGGPAGRGPAGAGAGAGGEPPAPPALPGRTGKALKWGVSALLIVALGLGSWQLAGTLLNKGGSGHAKGRGATQTHARDRTPSGKNVKIVDAKDFDPPPGDGSENPSGVKDAYDHDSSTYWLTKKYLNHPDFGHLKKGVGLILDLGKPRQVGSVKVDFMGSTSAELRAAPKNATGMPTTLGAFGKVAGATGEHVTMKSKKPVTSRYVLVWLTKLPRTEDGDYRGRITEIHVQS